MQRLQGVSGRVEGDGEISGGDIAQAKKDQCASDGGRLGSCTWLVGFIQRRSRGDSGGLRFFLAVDERCWSGASH